MRTERVRRAAAAVGAVRGRARAHPLADEAGAGQVASAAAQIEDSASQEPLSTRSRSFYYKYCTNEGSYLAANSNGRKFFI